MVVIWNMSPVRNEPDEKNDSVPKRLCELTNHLSCVNSVRWSRDGKYLASGGDDAIIMIWQIGHQGVVFGDSFGGPVHEQWRCVHMLRGHASDVLDLSWSPDQKYLASCSVDNSIVIWNAKELPQKLTVLAGHQGLVKGITWDPVGKYVASQSDDHSVRIWRVSDWKEVKSVTEPFKKCGGTTHVLRLSWSPDGKYIVSAHALNNDGPTAQIIERGTDWKTGMDFVGHRKAVEVVLFNPHLFVMKENKDNHGCLALGGRDRTLSIWLTNLKRPLLVMHDLFKDSILDLSWSADGYELLVCSTDGSVAYLSFSKKELGLRLSKQAFDDLYIKTYGFKRTEVTSKSSGVVLIETPEMLKLHSSSAGKVAAVSPSAKQTNLLLDGKAMATGSSAAKSSLTTAKQVESRTKDGKRRITPITLTTETTSALGAPLPFTSFSPKQNKGATVQTTPEKDRPKKSASGSEHSTPKSGAADVLESDASSLKPISFEPLSPKNEGTMHAMTPTPTKKVSSEDPTRKSEGDDQSRRMESKESEEPEVRSKNTEAKADVNTEVEAENVVKEHEVHRGQKRSGSMADVTLPKAKKAKKKSGVVHPGSSGTSYSHKPSTPQKQSNLQAFMKQSTCYLSPKLEPQITLTLMSSDTEADNPTVLINNEPVHSSLYSLEYTKTSGPVWKTTFLSPCLKAVANNHVTCIACQDKSLSIFSTPTGRLIISKLYQSGDVLDLKVKDHFLMYVSCLGELSVWDIRNMIAIVRNCSFHGLLLDSRQPPDDFHLTKTGLPVVHIGSSKFVHNTDMDCWMELCNSREKSELTTLQFQEAGIDSLPLESLQKDLTAATSSGGSRGDAVGQMLRDIQHGSSPQSSTLVFLESQISRCLCLKSPLEYQHWCKAYVQFLVKDNLETKLREFCSGFSVPSGKKDRVLGFLKINLLQDFITIVAKNPKFQRLYQELKDTLDQTLK